MMFEFLNINIALEIFLFILQINWCSGTNVYIEIKGISK